MSRRQSSSSATGAGGHSWAALDQDATTGLLTVNSRDDAHSGECCPKPKCLSGFEMAESPSPKGVSRVQVLLFACAVELRHENLGSSLSNKLRRDFGGIARGFVHILLADNWKHDISVILLRGTNEVVRK